MSVYDFLRPPPTEVPGIVNVNAFLTPPPTVGLTDDCWPPVDFPFSPTVGQRAAPLEAVTPTPLESVIPTPLVYTNEMAAVLAPCKRNVFVGKRPVSEVDIICFSCHPRPCERISFEGNGQAAWYPPQ